MPRPWWKGRVVLIGDAVHATTPHLGAGRALQIEDAIVLAQEIEQKETLPAALTAYEDRRFERCRMVVENSLRLGEIEVTNGDHVEHAGIMHKSALALAEPISLVARAEALFGGLCDAIQLALSVANAGWFRIGSSSFRAIAAGLGAEVNSPAMRLWVAVSRERIVRRPNPVAAT